MNLFNLKDDIGEKDNIAEKHPEIVKKLLQKMLKFDEQLTKNAKLIGN